MKLAIRLEKTRIHSLTSRLHTDFNLKAITVSCRSYRMLYKVILIFTLDEGPEIRQILVPDFNKPIKDPFNEIDEVAFMSQPSQYRYIL